MCYCLPKGALIPAVLFRIAKFDLGNKNKSICEPGPAIFVTKLLFLRSLQCIFSLEIILEMQFNGSNIKILLNNIFIMNL
jgi:hypothetical protein